jgi:hypothetical protein
VDHGQRGGEIDQPVQALPVLLQPADPPRRGRDGERQQNRERRHPREDEATLQDVFLDRPELAGLERVAELIEHEIGAQVNQRVRERPHAEHPAGALENVPTGQPSKRRNRQRDEKQDQGRQARFMLQRLGGVRTEREKVAADEEAPRANAQPRARCETGQEDREFEGARQ